MFTNPTIEKRVLGAEKPYKDPDGKEHDFSGRCMIVIVDSCRWMIAQ